MRFGRRPATPARNINIDGMRLHLRTDPDGSGMLTINASAVLHLDRVAVDYLRHYLMLVENPPKRGTIPENVAAHISKRYRVSRKQAQHDFEQLLAKIVAVARGDLCPFSDCEIERVDPFSKPLRAPYRIDCALTYRCQNNCAHCYLQGGPHQTAKLTTDDWKRILTKISEFEVPSVCFTGGEPLLRDDLEELIAKTQELGIISGLITNGRLLTEERVKRLSEAGLDYVQITLESSDSSIHDSMVGAKGAWNETTAGVRNAAKILFTTTNTTLIPVNRDSMLKTVDSLHSLGVSRMGMNAIIRSGRGEQFNALPEEQIQETLHAASAHSQELGMQFIWYTPTCYRQLNPVELGLGVKRCSAASTVLAIEPNGQIIPCQSWFESIGNALENSFSEVWMHPLALRLRNREYLSDKCRECENVSLCAGGCPLENTCRQG